MKTILRTFSVLAIALVAAAGCSTAPQSSADRSDLITDAQQTVALFRRQDPTIERFFNSSVAYAVYPTIAKGGLIVGGAYGRGVLFENGRFTSYCDVTQGTVGFQIGGQGYSEIIFFENQGSLNEFKSGALAFAAQATAVAVTYGAAANLNYDNGVAVLVGDQKGLMAEAAIGGQKFSVVSSNDAGPVGDQRVVANRNEHDVYGYADDNDAAWRNDSEYNRLYDANRNKTISGEVTSIGEFQPTRDAQKGRQMMIRDDEGRTHTVHLGPISYLEREDNLRIKEGDRVTVSGSPAVFEGREVLIARDILGRDNQRLELRDAESRPRWNVSVSTPRR